MIRKLMVVLLGASICLMGLGSPLFAQPADNYYATPKAYEEATGKTIEKFSEAPMLKVMVAAGELPPVEQRLPEEPLVVKPFEEIGQYGGTLRGHGVGTNWSGQGILSTRLQGGTLLKLMPDLITVAPNVAKGWDLSEDYKTLTVYLRKGMKWSDGVPFTADDILFWYEDDFLNEKLTPVAPIAWAPAGNIVKVTKIDDYTVQFQWPVPYPFIVTKLSDYIYFCSPKHYLSKFHIDYNPKANELAKEEGYDNWWTCFAGKKDWFQFHNTDLPVLYPWVLKEIDTAGNKYFTRNPYYWKIDTAGNQLPYIDELRRTLVSNVEVVKLKTIAGEFSMAAQLLSLEDYPLYKTNEEKGDYHVMLWQQPWGSAAAFWFNLYHEDPVLGKIFQDIRFRQAMSLAIDRDEINEALFFGKATPRQAVPAIPGVRFYEDWMGNYYAEYEPEKANKLLDEMGLKWDKNHQYRLRSDGKPLAITVEYVEVEGPKGKICEIVKEFWEAVGVKTAVKEQSGELYDLHANSGLFDVVLWHLAESVEQTMISNVIRLYPPHSHNLKFTKGWYNWYYKIGTEESRIEPPENVKRCFELIDKWQLSLPGSDEYVRLGKEWLTIIVNNLWMVGTVGNAPTPVIIKNNLRNTPKDGKWTSDYHFFWPYQGDQWFFEK